MLCLLQIEAAAQELAARQAAEEASREANEQDILARKANLQEQASKMDLTLATLQVLEKQAQLQAQLQAQVHAQLLPKPWFRRFIVFGSFLLGCLLAVLMYVPAASSRS